MSRTPTAWVLAALALAPAAAGCSRQGQPLRLAAAASLSEILPGLLAEFSARTGREVLGVYGSSGSLAVQAATGAPFDAVLLAGAAPMDRLEVAGLLLPGSRRVLLRNRLVLVTLAQTSYPAPAPELGEALAPFAGARVAIGGAGVPAGEYARQWLRRSGLAGPEDAAPGFQFVVLEHARAVVEAVASWACPVGFVYASDARSEDLRVLATASRADTDPIGYPAAVLAASRNPAEAAALLEHLAARAAVFEEAGFRVTGPGAGG